MARSAGVLLTWAGSAAGYCRTTTCDATGYNSDECAPDAAGCSTLGIPLAWRRHCFGFGTSSRGPANGDVTVEDTQATLSGAIHAWNSISCRGLPPAISIVLWDPIACDVAEYNATGPNANILVWVDEGWDHGVATVALTTVTFAPSTGEILGADIELNSQGFQFTVGNVGFGMDLGSTVTHELGHVLGLSHSSERDATMSPVQMPGEVGLQTLETDDVEGLCAIYPPGTPMAPCDPNYDFSPRCGGNVVGGCTVSPGRPPLRGTPATGWPGYAAFGLVAGGFRRRRKAGRAKRPGRGDD